MRTLRTPDDRFQGLAGYPFAPHYADVPDQDGSVLRMHYLDEGPADGPVVLLLHGEPSWSYLYRTMIPLLAGRALRCIAPDLVGFGRSDKPTERADYTYARHVEWVRSLVVDVLDLRDVTLFGQDWGGLLGLRLVAENPSRFARVAIGNAMLPDGSQPASDAFLDWQRYSQTTPVFTAGAIISRAVAGPLADGAAEAYDAPFPDESYLAGARAFPALVPTSPQDPAADANAAARAALTSWQQPFLTLFSDGDPVTGGADRWFHSHVPGAQGQPHATLSPGGHFLQEDVGPELAGRLADWIGAPATA